MNKGNAESQAYLGMMFVVMFWGLSWPAGRFISLEFGDKVITAAFIRFSFAFPFLFLISKLYYKKISIPRSFHKQIFVLGLLQVALYNYLYFTGLRFTSASDAALIIAINPILTAIFASFVYADERLTKRKSMGFLLAFSGELMIFLFSPNTQVSNRILGDLIIFGGALVWALYSTFSRPVYEHVEPITYQAWASFYGWLGLGVVSLFENPLSVRPSTTSWLILIYLGLFAAAIANSIFSFGIKSIGPSKTSIFVNLVPILGAILATLLLGENFSYIYILAFFLIISGVRLVTKRETSSTEYE